MQVTLNNQRKFSWLKALGHSIAIASAFLLPGLAVAVSEAVDPTRAGEFSGGFIVSGFILGWIWSYARQNGYSTVKHILVFILVAMSAFEVFVLAAAVATRRKSSPAALEDRPPASHQTADGVVLCQQDLGVRVPLEKVSLAPAPDLSKTLKQKDPNDAVARWVYREGSGDIVVLMAAKGFDSKESLQNFAKGAASAAERRRMEKIQDAVEWDAGHGSIVLSFRQGETAHFDMRCISAPNGDLACLQTIGSGPDRLAGLREHLSFGSCP